MAKVAIELTEAEYEALKSLAKEHKRTPKGQAEWILTQHIEEVEGRGKWISPFPLLATVGDEGTVNSLSGDPLCE